MKRPRSPYAGVYCDVNARITDRHYSLNTRGSLEDLKKLGLTPRSALGSRFTFVGGDDGGPRRPDDIMFEGVVVHHAEWGYVAEVDVNGVYHRSELADGDS